MTETTIRSEADLLETLEHLQRLDLSKEWIVSWERPSKPKSYSQLKLYYRWVKIAGDEMGMWKEDMDECLRNHCDAPKHYYTDMDGNERWRYSLSNAEKGEMAQFLDRVSMFLASEHGVILPHPSDQQRNW